MTFTLFLRKIKKSLANYVPSPAWPWEIISGLLIVVLLINNIKNIFGESALNKIAAFSLVIMIVCLFWGAIDGLMYIFTSILERGRYNKMSVTVESLGRESAIKLITDEADQIIMIDILGEDIKKQIIDAVYKKFSSDKLKIRAKIRVSQDDIIGALIHIFFVFLPCIIVLPFFISIGIAGKLDFAILFANIIGLMLFFAFGYKLGSCINRNKILTGALITVIGIIAILSGTVFGA